jgi:hypothetical protein
VALGRVGKEEHVGAAAVCARHYPHWLCADCARGTAVCVCLYLELAVGSHYSSQVAVGQLALELCV